MKEIYYLVIQSTYASIEMALYKNFECIETSSIDKLKASKLCLTTLEQLLNNNSIDLNAISFIGVNQGPGPFTTLRVVISLINGLSFARKIPLIGIDGLKALIDESATAQSAVTVALLNAFAKDLYYGIFYKGIYISGCENNETLLVRLAQEFSTQKILFCGNGALAYANDINALFGDRAILGIEQQMASLPAIAKAALTYWQSADRHLSYQVQPLYLKQAFIGS